MAIFPEINELSDDEFETLQQQMQEEAKRRERERIVPLGTPKWEDVLVAAQSAVDEEIANGEIDTQYLYEAVLEAVYGPGIFQRISDLKGD